MTNTTATLAAEQWEQVRMCMINTAESVPEDLSWPLMETYHALAKQTGYDNDSHCARHDVSFDNSIGCSKCISEMPESMQEIHRRLDEQMSLTQEAEGW